MLITLKTLQQQTFKIDVVETNTVLELKEKIAHEKGSNLYQVCDQKLISSGKVMEDSKTLKDYKISEKGFIVVMVTKPKIAPVPAPVTETSTPSLDGDKEKTEAAVATTAVDSESTAASVTAAAPAAAVSATAAATEQAPPADGNGFISSDEYQRTVTEIMAMGFERSQVDLAMRAAFNNADRAVEFLLSGDDFASSGDAASPMAMAAVSGTEVVDLMEASAEDSGDADFVAQLQAWPQLQQMRQLVQSNPSMLPELLQQLGGVNPSLLESIQRNQERFLAFLNAPLATSASEESDEEGADEGEEEGGGEGGAFMPAQIRVTQLEREAVDRLKALGFPEHLVIQAYFACDKNEDAAANFLLNEGMFEDEEFGV